MRSWDEFFDLKGKVAVVTGGAKGIGRGIALRLAAQGATVVVAGHDELEAKELEAAVVERGRPPPLFVQAEMRDLGQIERLVETTKKSCGRLDILVNNAGIFPFSPALSVTPQVWDRVLQVNLRGPFFLAQAAARAMQAQGEGGSIVNVSSVGGLHPNETVSVYDTSKGGLEMMTRALALEFAPLGIRVNAVAPGSIETPGLQRVRDMSVSSGGGPDPQQVEREFVARIPLGRRGEVDEVARAVLFLVSPAATYITGATLVVDGGYLLS